MSTRRDALKLFAISACCARLAQQTKEVETQPGHLQAGTAAANRRPPFLQPAEFKTIEALSERIIPRTDTPGAKDAGVALLIDKAIVADPTVMQPYRAGIADLNALAISSYGSEFAALDRKAADRDLDSAQPRNKFLARQILRHGQGHDHRCLLQNRSRA